jgi:ribonuclease-3
MRHRFGQTLKNESLWEEKLIRLQERIGYFFQDARLLCKALTHSSFRYEAGIEEDNERLEFIGDAVLQLLVTEKLLALFPEATEGDLTKKRSALVCEETLLKHEKRLNLYEFLRVGKGMEKQGLRGTRSVRADAVEALIGAIYYDGGLPAAEIFFSEALFEKEGYGSGLISNDPKSSLQEFLQASGKPLPEYILIEKSGQDDAPHFLIAIRSGEDILATGAGYSKKEAEFAAARRALEILS